METEGKYEEGSKKVERERERGREGEREGDRNSGGTGICGQSGKKTLRKGG